MLDTPAPGAGPPLEDRDLGVVAAAIAVTAHAVQRPTADTPPITGAELLDALMLPPAPRNPGKAAGGKRLHSLERDPGTATIVERIFTEYVGGRGRNSAQGSL